MASYLLFVFLIIPHTGVYSEVVSLPFRGNSHEKLTIHWILQWMDGDMRNVSVRHESFTDPQVMWRVNGNLVSETGSVFVVSNTRFRHENIHESQTVSVTSILIPASVVISKLELQLVNDVTELVLLINVPHLEPNTKALERVPSFNLDLDHWEHVQYTVNRTNKILVLFYSEILNESRWKPFTAEFIGIDNCVAPSRADVRTPQQNRDFIRLTTPRESQLDWNIRGYLVDPNCQLRHIRFDSRSEEFWGLLKITSGFVTNDACNFFGGVEVTKTSFLRPPTHGDFFTNHTTVFVKPGVNFRAVKGQDIDISITAIGGSEKEWTLNPSVEYPSVTLTKNGRSVSGSERIDVLRLFQREVIIRFRNVTENEAGRYLAKATMARGRARHNFNLLVTNIC